MAQGGQLPSENERALDPFGERPFRPGRLRTQGQLPLQEVIETGSER